MSQVSKLYENHIQVDKANHTVDIVNHDASTKGLKLAGTLVTATAAELNKMDGVTSTAAELNILTGVTATAAELNIAADASAQTETIDAGGTVSAVKRITKIGGTGAGAVTLAAPNATMLGLVKIIEMSAAAGAVTMALTNVDGGSAATSASFDAIGEVLILVAGVSKWHVIKEIGVTLS